MTVQSTTPDSKSSLLRRALQANAAFSGVSGIALTVAAGPLSTFLGLNAPLILIAIGVMLIFYALSLIYDTRQEPINRRSAITAIALDTVWVVASEFVLLTGLVSFTPAGWWAVAFTADIVAVFAIVQFIGLRRMQRC